MESERSFLREVGRFFAHLFPGAATGLHPSSFPIVACASSGATTSSPCAALSCPRASGGRTGDPVIVDSTLLAVLHPREVSQSGGWGSSSAAGAAWVRWGSFSVYGVKLHLLCATNRVPVSYELTPANTADLSLTEELCSPRHISEAR